MEATRSHTKETRYQEPACHYSACSSTPSAAASCAPSSPASPGSPSDPSLSQISSAGGAVLPTWMLRKKSKTAGLHLSSPVDRPRATSASLLRRLLDPRPHRSLSVFPFVTVLERWSLVPLLFSGSHHQQWSSGLLSVLSKYTPVRACPDLS